LGTELAELDALAEPLLRIRQQDSEGLALCVLEVDADGIAVANAHISGDGSCTNRVAFGSKRPEARRGDVRRAVAFVGGVGLGSDHLGLAVGADGGGVREELAASRKLLLGEAERDVEQAVEVLLRLVRRGISPRTHAMRRGG
jgi:hypothetical protein